MSHHTEHHEEAHSHMKIMVMVFVTLLVLTIITVVASQIHFGADWINILIAMLIASIKVFLVATYFMHLRWEEKVIRNFAFISFPLIALMMGFDIWDLAVRVLHKLYVF